MGKKTATAPVEPTVVQLKNMSTKIAAKTSVNPSEDDGAAKRRKKNNNDTFSSYAYRVLKKTCPELGVTKKSMNILDAFVKDIFERICGEASNLARHAKRQTISSKDIQNATRLVLPGELASHAVASGLSAVTKYNASMNADSN